MSEQEERLQIMLRSSGGTSKVARTMEYVLYDKAPTFIRNVKGRSTLYEETMIAASTILGEELSKGEDNLYNRLRYRIDNYWIDITDEHLLHHQ